MTELPQFVEVFVWSYHLQNCPFSKKTDTDWPGKVFCSEVSLVQKIQRWGIKCVHIEGFHTYTPLCCIRYHAVHLLYVVLR